jgi:hypothetical protein
MYIYKYWEKFRTSKNLNMYVNSTYIVYKHFCYINNQNLVFTYIGKLGQFVPKLKFLPWRGGVALWSSRPLTEQKILGSNPARV